MFTDGQLDGQTDAGELHPEELIIQKGPSNLDSRYPSMPEPTGGLEGGGGLVPRPTGILSSNTCPGNSNFPEYAYNITC